MKASKVKNRGVKTLTGIAAFDRRDLGDELQKYKAAGRWVKPKTRPTSVALSEETIEALREKATRKGIGYQTLLKMIVQEHLHEY